MQHYACDVNAAVQHKKPEEKSREIKSHEQARGVSEEDTLILEERYLSGSSYIAFHCKSPYLKEDVSPGQCQAKT